MRLIFDTKKVLELDPSAVLLGDYSGSIEGIASLEEAGSRDLSFLGNLKYAKQLSDTKAGVVLIPKDLDQEPRSGQSYIKVENPSALLAQLCHRLEQEYYPKPSAGISPLADIDPSASVHESAHVGAFCSIAAGAKIGPNCIIKAHATIGRNVVIGEGTTLNSQVVIGDYCELGKYIIIHPGSVIGADGFGYWQDGTPPNLVHRKIPQIGIVRIEDDVEIGSNTTIDCARFGETVIGAGTKIDNQVQIGHNVTIGRCCIICSQVGISGSTKVGDYVVFWGQVGTVGHINIGSGSFIGGKAGLTKDVPPGSNITGNPANPLLKQRRIDALTNRLPELFKRLKTLEDKESEK